MKTMIFDFDERNIEKISQLLAEDKVGAIPCDTIYGFCARSNNSTREKIYELNESTNKEAELIKGNQHSHSEKL